MEEFKKPIMFQLLNGSDNPADTGDNSLALFATEEDLKVAKEIILDADEDAVIYIKPIYSLSDIVGLKK